MEKPPSRETIKWSIGCQDCLISLSRDKERVEGQSSGNDDEDFRSLDGDGSGGDGDGGGQTWVS